MQGASISERRQYRGLLAAAVAAVLTAYFGWVGWNRLIARDEGFYLYAAREVAEGRIPYLDFFYPQMPLLPYLFAAWGAVFGLAWHSLRIFAALACTGLGLLLYLAAERRAGRLAGCVVAMLFAGSVFVFPWFAAAQTYAFASLLLFGAWYLAADRRKFFLCGVLFGLAVAVRLPLAVGLFALLLEAWYEPHERRLHSVIALLCGAMLPAAPVLLLAAQDPWAFYFNNVGYHLVRVEPTAKIAEKPLHVLALLLGLRYGAKFDSFQFPFLLIAALSDGVLGIIRRCVPSHAVMALLLIAVHFLPTPTYVQYFGCAVPYLLLSVAALWRRTTDISKPRVSKRFAGVMALLACIVYIFHVPADLQRYLVTGKGVTGIMRESEAAEWNIEMAENVAAGVAAAAPPGSEVLASWPGFLIGTPMRALSGAEDQFGVGLALERRVSSETLRRARIITAEEIDLALHEGSVPLVVTRADSALGRLVVQAPYELVDQRGRTGIWRSKFSSTEAASQ